MTMNVTRKTRVFGIVVLAVFTALVLLQKPIAGESSREADGARLLRGAIDMHFHVDATTPAGTGEQADIAKVRVARMRGLRGLVLKNHFEPTSTLAYLLRKEVPDIELFGGIVMNLTNGGMNPAAVEYMATRIKGAPAKIVWMPAGDSEIESRTSKQPNKPFVPVSRNGELLPGTKEVIVLVAKHKLVRRLSSWAPSSRSTIEMPSTRAPFAWTLCASSGPNTASFRNFGPRSNRLKSTEGWTASVHLRRPCAAAALLTASSTSCSKIIRRDCWGCRSVNR
jgi:hypothetical protein